MKDTLTNTLRELGFTPKQVKRIFNMIHYSGFKSTDVLDVEIHRSYDNSDWLRFYLNNEWEEIHEYQYTYVTR